MGIFRLPPAVRCLVERIHQRGGSLRVHVGPMVIVGWGSFEHFSRLGAAMATLSVSRPAVSCLLVMLCEQKWT